MNTYLKIVSGAALVFVAIFCFNFFSQVNKADAQTVVCPEVYAYPGPGLLSLNPCTINIEMIDGKGNINFSTIIKDKNSGFYGASGFEVEPPKGFPENGVIKNISSGGVGETASIDFTANDNVLSSDGNQPRVYTGTVPIHVFRGSSVPDGNYLTLTVNIKVLPASAPSPLPTSINRCNNLDSLYKSKLDQLRQDSKNIFYSSEGQETSSYSGVRQDQDFYFYYSQIANKARILQVSAGSPTILRDVITNETFTIAYDRPLLDTYYYGDVSSFVAVGSTIIDRQNVHVALRYRSTPRYSFIKITWGEGASPENSGNIKDFYDPADCPPPPPPPPPCYVFTNYLYEGNIGSEVVALQTWLIGHGFEISDLTLNGGKDKGTFGTSTKQAVINFQTSVGLPATGWVGPLTIAALNKDCSNPVPPLTDPQVVIGASPTLALSYSATSTCPAGFTCPITAPRESLLTSTFTFQVKGGSKGVAIYKDFGVNVYFRDVNGSNSPVGPDQYTLTSLLGASMGTDEKGNAVYIIPANKNAMFRVVASAKPSRMFAGTYYASIAGLHGIFNQNSNLSFDFSVNPNKTNTKLIIGELSPYITSVTTPVRVGTQIFISGQRLSNNGINNQIFIDNNLLSNTTVSGNGTSLQFILPSLSNGQHFIHLNDPKTGDSNRVYFEVEGNIIPTVNLTSTVSNSNIYNFTAKINTNNDKVTLRADCNNNEILINVKGGALCNENIPVNSTHGNYEYSFHPVTFSSKDGKSHLFGMTAQAYLNGDLVGTDREAISINPSTNGNVAPDINIGTAPTRLEVNQQGTWTVEASDPENGPLSYSVDWGETTTIAGSGGGSPSAAFVQSTTFNHTYRSAGTYKIVFTATDNTGQSNTASVTVQVCPVGYTCVTNPTPGSVTLRLSSASPASRIIAANQNEVTLAIIEIKANQTAVNNLNGIHIASDSTNASNYFTNIRVYDGSTLLGTAGRLEYNGSYYYQWINVSGVSIPAETWKQLRIVADIPSPANGSVRLGIGGLNFTAPGATVSGMPVYGSVITVLPPPSIVPTVTVSAPSATVSLNDNGTQMPISATVGYRFTVNNLQSRDIYLSKNINSFVVTEGNGSVAIPSALISTIPTSMAGDTATIFTIPAGTSRTFVLTGTLTNPNSDQSLISQRISKIYYSTSSNMIEVNSITEGFSSLSTPPIRIGGSPPPVIITSIAPATASAGTEVTLYGEFKGVTSLQLSPAPTGGYHNMTTFTNNISSLSFRVPSTFSSYDGTVRVTVVGGGQVSNSQNLRITPTVVLPPPSTSPSITTISPTTASAGMTVTLTGNFIGVNNIQWSKGSASSYELMDISSNNGTHINWTLPSSLSNFTGILGITVSKPNGNLNVISNPVNINVIPVATPPTPVSSLTVTSPNGSESWKINASNAITWAVPTSIESSVKSFRVTLMNAEGDTKIVVLYPTVPPTFRRVNYYFYQDSKFQDGYYKILVEALDQNGGLIASDLSDSSFIAKRTTQASLQSSGYSLSATIWDAIRDWQARR